MPKRSYLPSLSLFFTATVLAQTPEQRMETSILDEVIVTATRIDETVFEVPYTAHVIESTRFRDQRMVRTLSEALSETPGVMVQKTGYGQSSPFIRGFTGFRTLMLIDGIRLNNAVFREGPNQYWNTVDIFTVDRLDVVKGPSSVLYGSDAVGGTVNAITRSPEMLQWETTSKDSGKSVADKNVVAGNQGMEWHPAAYYRYATAENSHTARGEFGLSISPQVGVLGGITWKDYDDLRGGDLIGNQPNTGYTEIDGDIKFLIRPNENVDLTAAFYRTEQNDVPRTHSTVFAKSFDGTGVGTDLRRNLDQKRELAYIQAEIREAAPWLDKVNLSLSFHRQTEEQDRIRSNGQREVVGFEDDQYGMLLGFESKTGIGTLTYGLEYYHDQVQSWGSDFNADGSLRSLRSRGPVADDSTYDLLGIYLQDQFRPVDPLEITMGVRYSWAEIQASDIDPNKNDDVHFNAIDKTFDALTASIRARYDVTNNWNFFGGVSQGFRAPNLSDFTSFELARSGELETPAPDLEAENYTSFEIGTKARIPNYGIDLYGAFFHTLIDNQIVRFPTGNTIDGSPEVSRANVGDGYVQGIEIGAEWKFYKGFTFFGNLTWTEGELGTFVGNDIAARPASRIQPLSGLVGLRWQSENEKWFLEASAQLVRHQDRLSPGDAADTQRIPPGGTGGYEVYTVRGGWNPTPNMKFFVACENFTDTDYRVHGSGSNEPGTNVVLGTQLRF